MRTLILVLLILALAITVSKLTYSEPGLLSISYQNWIVETSPIVVLVVGVVALALLLITLKLISIALGIPGFFHNRSRAGRNARAQKHLTKGYVELAEGRWQQAEKHLSHVEVGQETSAINYLAAARAAHFQAATDRRDRFLEQAAEVMPKGSTAVDITRAELQIEQRDFEGALETLSFLRSSSPRHPYVIKLLAGVYLEQKNWSKLDALLPVIRRRKALDASGISSIERACWRGMLETGDDSRLDGYWQRLPKPAQQSSELLTLFVDRLVDAGKHSIAEKLLRDRLNKQWDEQLLPVYAKIELDDASKQLGFAENWIANHGRNAELLLTLGQLCLRCQLWGKARVYLESSLGIRDSAIAALALADLLVQLGENDNARDYYASGLKLALNKTGDGNLPAVIEKTDDSDSPESEESNSGSPVDLKLVENKASNA